MEFDAQMKALSEKAKAQIDDREVKKSYPGLQDALRPIIAGIEALGRATLHHSAALEKIERSAFAQESLPKLLETVQSNIEQRDAVSQQLFNSLHQELKGYKDQFILEILHKPIIRDLITLFDDLSELQRQMAANVAEQGARETSSKSDLVLADHLNDFCMNLNHVSHFLLEILARMEVSRAPDSTGKWDREKHHAVGVEMAGSAEEDGEIVRSCKPAFVWRGRVVRTEEVVIKKWKEGYLVAIKEPKK